MLGLVLQAAGKQVLADEFDGLSVQVGAGHPGTGEAGEGKKLSGDGETSFAVGFFIERGRCAETL